jgi:uncharacterized protein (TIGR03089 family)
VTELIAERFRRRIRTSGAGPLITYYDPATWVPTELSAITFGNWVDKTSNLLVDELSVEAGDQVELELARRHPGHWVTLIWELAVWQVGATVTFGRDASAAVIVVGPDIGGRLEGSGGRLVACSLHPLGLGLPQPPPAGVMDYSAEVRQQSDRYLGAPVDPAARAWDEVLPAGPLPGGPDSWLAGPIEPAADRPPEAARRLNQLELVTRPPQAAQRRLLQPTDAWSVASAFVDAILWDGSLVVVPGSVDPHRLARIAEDQRAFD